MQNPCATRAVRVEWRGFVLGYAPKTENRAVVRLFDNGVLPGARLKTLRECSNPWKRVQLEILVRVEIVWPRRNPLPKKMALSVQTPARTPPAPLPTYASIRMARG
ncbi:MAG: HIRAN domain-containing protein [Sulfuricellaceae bacterium]